jgi:hypothetical protein
MPFRRDRVKPREKIPIPSLEMHVPPDTKPTQLQGTPDEKGIDGLSNYAACHPIGMKDQFANIAASAGRA